MRRQPLADVALQLLLHRLAWELDVGEDISVTRDKSVLVLNNLHLRDPYVIDSLKASKLLPYFLSSPACQQIYRHMGTKQANRLNGQPMFSYSSRIGVWVFSAQCRRIECTSLALLYRSSARIISSGETRRCRPCQPYVLDAVLAMSFATHLREINITLLFVHT